MRICYFGTYSQGEGYPMNEVLIRGLRLNDVEIVECHENLWQERLERAESADKGWIGLFHLAWRMARAYLALSRKFLRMGPYDAIIVGYPAHLDFFVARLLNGVRKKRPIIVNLLFSLHDTLVNDRKKIPAKSWRAKILRVLDRKICMSADRVILDTQTHIDYFEQTFAIPRGKFIHVPVGADDVHFRPQPAVPASTENPECRVLFFGTYIPLHGIEIILQAAHILRNEANIRFTLLGSGQTLPEMRALADTLGLQHVTFMASWHTYSDLAKQMHVSDICLGIFGTTQKAQRVIPCKIYNGLAMGMPTITADTPAAREILVSGENALLSPSGDPQALAEAILLLRDHPDLRNRIGQAGYELFRKTLSPQRVGQQVKKAIENI